MSDHDAAARGMVWELAEARNALAVMRERAQAMEAEVHRLAAMVRASDSDAQNEAERMCDRVVELEAESARLQKYIDDCTDDATKLLEQVRAAELAVAARDMTNAVTIANLRAQVERLAPRQRAGQLVANAMHWLDPTFYENSRNTMADPWEHDERVGAYLEAWRTHLLSAGPSVEVDDE